MFKFNLFCKYYILYIRRDKNRNLAQKNKDGCMDKTCLIWYYIKIEVFCLEEIQ
mgnify:CR=1 FL=1